MLNWKRGGKGAKVSITGAQSSVFFSNGIETVWIRSIEIERQGKRRRRIHKIGSPMNRKHGGHGTNLRRMVRFLGTSWKLDGFVLFCRFVSRRRASFVRFPLSLRWRNGRRPPPRPIRFCDRPGAKAKAKTKIATKTWDERTKKTQRKPRRRSEQKPERRDTFRRRWRFFSSAEKLDFQTNYLSLFLENKLTIFRLPNMIQPNGLPIGCCHVLSQQMIVFFVNFIFGWFNIVLITFLWSKSFR